MVFLRSVTSCDPEIEAVTMVLISPLYISLTLGYLLTLLPGDRSAGPPGHLLRHCGALVSDHRPTLGPRHLLEHVGPDIEINRTGKSTSPLTMSRNRWRQSSISREQG